MTIPRFHDGYLVGISVGEETATLSLKTHDGVGYNLFLAGVRALHMDDFKAGNILLSLDIITSCEPDPDYFPGWQERLFLPPHESADRKYHEAHAASLAGELARLVDGRASLVAITPAYGADLVALCDSVRLDGPLTVA